MQDLLALEGRVEFDLQLLPHQMLAIKAQP